MVVSLFLFSTSAVEIIRLCIYLFCCVCAHTQAMSTDVYFCGFSGVNPVKNLLRDIALRSHNSSWLCLSWDIPKSIILKLQSETLHIVGEKDALREIFIMICHVWLFIYTYILTPPPPFKFQKFCRMQKGKLSSVSMEKCSLFPNLY